jgi:hypothetical protein
MYIFAFIVEVPYLVQDKELSYERICAVALLQ